jgi:hypothetical protein
MPLFGKSGQRIVAAPSDRSNRFKHLARILDEGHCTCAKKALRLFRSSICFVRAELGHNREGSLGTHLHEVRKYITTIDCSLALRICIQWR